MRLVVQRVSSARVTVDEGAGLEVVVGEIGPGLLIFLGIDRGDGEDEAQYLTRKVSEVRVFSDDEGKMNLDVQQVGGSALVVSQFTLCADLQRGRRPGFDRAMPPAQANPLYLRFADLLRRAGVPTRTGRFGAHMRVSLVNDGPVTLWFERSSPRPQPEDTANATRADP